MQKKTHKNWVRFYTVHHFRKGNWSNYYYNICYASMDLTCLVAMMKCGTVPSILHVGMPTFK